MNCTGIRFRWIYAACYELELPGGTRILMDPYITPAISRDVLDVASLEKPDYILITHTHFDHVHDVGFLANKYRPKIIMGANAANALAVGFDLEYDLFYPMSTGDKYFFSNCTIEAYRGKHTLHNKAVCRPSVMEGVSREKYGWENFGLADQMGDMETIDYVITTNNNIRIMISSGGLELQNAWEIARECRPDIVIRQLSGGKMEPEKLGAYLANYHAQLILPFHHESMKKRGIDADEYIGKVQEALNKLSPGSTFFNPKQFCWYRSSLHIEEE